MSNSLAEQRDRLQRQVEELEQNLSVRQEEIELLSSDTDGGSDCNEEEDESSDLLFQRNKVQREIENLENLLEGHSPIILSDEDDSSSDESDLGLPQSIDSCLQMNLVYQQVVQDTLNQLEVLLTQNLRQQKELMSELSGPIRVPVKEQPTSSSYEQRINMYLGHFLKPYFKDKLTGLGPPPNEEFKERTSRMVGTLDNNRLKVRRWESWQKNLLIHAVSGDHLRKLIQPKLSRLDYLNQKLISAELSDKPRLQEQINGVEEEIDSLRAKSQEELLGQRFEEHDWQKISNIDFEETRDPEDLRCFWQNFLHPSINKSAWSREEVEQLSEVSGTHQETDWKSIAEELGTGRTAFMCLQVFQRFISDSFKRSAWTPNEDALLSELVSSMRIGNFIPYTQMSYFMDGREPTQLVYRWNQVLDPSLKKGVWTADEDQLLLQAVSRHGERNWWKIRLEVPGRTDSGCRDRYLDCLKEGRKNGPFDKQEKNLLLVLVQKYGVGRWSKISAEIPHRNDAQCLRAWRTLTHQQKPRGRKKRRGGAAKASSRQTLQKVKEEEEDLGESMEEEEEEEVVEYMDSDDEKKGKVKVKEEPQQKEEEEYVLPPMQQWVPLPWQEPTLRFYPVVLPPTPSSSSSSSSSSFQARPIRCTILRRRGPEEFLGPPPCILPQWKRRSDTLMMLYPEVLRPRLHANSHRLRRFQGFFPHLRSAILPWIGRLLMCRTNFPDVSNKLRERAEKRHLPSGSVFIILLQASCVDVDGCKEVIEQRKNSQRPKNPVRPQRSNTAKGPLQQRRSTRQPPQKHTQKASPPPPSTSLPPAVLVPNPPSLKPRAGTTLFFIPDIPNAPSVAPTMAPGQAPRVAPGLVPGLALSVAPSQVCGPNPGLAPGHAHIVAPSLAPSLAPSRFPSVAPRLAPFVFQQPAAPFTRLSDPQEEVQGGGVSSTSDLEKQVSAPPSSPLTNQQAGFLPGAALTPPSIDDGRKKKRKEELCEGEVGGVQPGKRLRKPSHKIRLVKEAETEAQKKKALKTQRKRPRQSGNGTRTRTRAGTGTGTRTGAGAGTGTGTGAGSGLQTGSSQSLWLMTPGGLVQVALVPKAPPPPVVATVIPQPTPVILQLSPPVANQIKPCPLPPSPSLRLPQTPVPHIVARTNPAVPQPHIVEEYQLDPTLMFLEPQARVTEWLSGSGGLSIPGLRDKLPYFPPFISTMRCLSILLKSRESLIHSALDILDNKSFKNTARKYQNMPTGQLARLTNHQDTPLSHLTEPRKPPTTPLNGKDLLQTGPAAPTVDEVPGTPPADLPDSTCDQPDKQQQQKEEEEEEAALLLEVRQVVSERLSANPAYQLLKARFLSYFTVPAFLATLPPRPAVVEEPQGEELKLEQQEEEQERQQQQEQEEEEEEDEEEAQSSAQLCDIPESSANHFTGIFPRNQREPGSNQDQQQRIATK